MSRPLYASLLMYNEEEDYREYYRTTYWKKEIQTLDCITVLFRHSDFDHLCYESTKRNKEKDAFSWTRAQRLGWIKKALADSTADLFIAWDCSTQSYDIKKRTCLVGGNYVVVIRLTAINKATIVTAFPVGLNEEDTLTKLRSSPAWKMPRCLIDKANRP